MLRLKIVKPVPPAEVNPATTRVLVIKSRPSSEISLAIPPDNIEIDPPAEVSHMTTQYEIHPHCKFPIESDLHRDLYDALQEKGYQCLTPYVSSNSNIHVICPNGHKWDARAKKLMIPCNNCKKCWKIYGVNAKERVAQVIQSRGGTQLAPYDPKIMKVQCEKGHIFERRTASINQGTWCTVCPDPNFARCKARFERVVKEKNLTVLSPYIDTHKTVQLMCHVGHTYWQAPSDLYRTSGCSHCRGLTKEASEIKFRKYVQDKGGVITGEYINNCTKVSVVCDKGHNFAIAPSNTLRGGWCSKCAGTCPKQAAEKFMRNVVLMRGTIIGDYVNCETKVAVQCEFEHVFNMSPGHIGKGAWCPECQGHCPIAAERKFREVVAKRGGMMIGQYINSYTKIDVVCAKGHEFKISQGNAVFNGLWCKVCGQSETHGERAIREYLVSKSISYDTEVTFDWYPNGRYDFSFKHNNMEFLVEFDGGQHFSYVHYFHKNEERFNRARQRDINKSKAAMINGYHLIRIADTNIFDVDEILETIIESPELSERLLVSDHEKYTWLFEALALL